MSDRIETLKRELVKAREANEKAKALSEKAWKAVESTEAYTDYDVAKMDFATAAEAMLVADKALRDAALEEFGTTTDGPQRTATSAGVTIKFHHKIKYDVDAAITWCWEKYKGLILLDKKEFEKAKPNGAPWEPVEIPYVELATKNADFQLKEG